MKAVVMAGGEGTRLRPLTSNQPKPMVPIVGKPCMEHIVELLKPHGFDDIVVTLAFMPQAIRGYFGDGETHGVSIRYSVEETPGGHGRLGEARRGGARRAVPRHLRRRALRHRPGALVRFHREKEALVTIGLKSVDNPLEFGIVVTDEDGRIERFLEKPSWGQVFTDTINTGIYVLEPEVLATCRPTAVRLLQGALPAPPRDGQAAVRLRRRRLLAGHRQPRPVPQANFDALDGKVGLDVPGIRLRGNVWVGEGSSSPTSSPSRGRRSSATTAASAATRPSARTRCSAERHAARARATTRSVVDSATYIGRSALVEGAIVGKSCDIRPHARPRGRRDRRPDDDRGRERRLPRRPDLPVQGGRGGRPRRPQPDLGVRGRLDALRARCASGPDRTST